MSIREEAEANEREAREHLRIVVRKLLRAGDLRRRSGWEGRRGPRVGALREQADSYVHFGEELASLSLKILGREPS